MRPFIQVQAPSWDGKIVLAGIFIVGYYGLVILLILAKKHLEQAEAQMVRDAMLALGPGIGIILGALFRSTAAEERQSIANAQTLKTAIETPTTVVAPAAIGDQVEEGARDGARAGVRDGLSERTDETPHYDGPDLPPTPAAVTAPEEPTWG